MKKISLLGILIALSFSCFSQKLVSVRKFGALVNIESYVREFLPQVNIGAFADISLTKRVDLRFEAATRKDFSYYTFTQNLLSFSPMIQFHGKRFAFAVGPTFYTPLNERPPDQIIVFNTSPNYISGDITRFSNYNNLNLGVSTRFTYDILQFEKNYKLSLAFQNTISEYDQMYFGLGFQLSKGK